MVTDLLERSVEPCKCESGICDRRRLASSSKEFIIRVNNDKQICCRYGPAIICFDESNNIKGFMFMVNGVNITKKVERWMKFINLSHTDEWNEEIQMLYRLNWS